MNNIWVAFLTGITTGGLSCLAVQGGLLATSVTQDGEIEAVKSQRWQKVGMFLVAKLVAYTLLGFSLGALGSSFVFSPNLLGLMQILAGLFMLITAARLLNLHPFFRYFTIQPPKFIYKILRNKSKSKSYFAPAILGFLTVLIPCGVTQAMMVLAVASASPLLGAGIMFAFTLGTSPIFFAIGLAAVELFNRKWFKYAAATAIIVLGLLSINTGQVLRGSTHTVQNYWVAVKGLFIESKNIDKVADITGGKQQVTINVESTRYKTSASTLKANVPVSLKLVTNNVQGCIRAFTIPSLKISKVLPETGTEIVEFTPTKTGRLGFTCSMGMFGGEFMIIN